MSFEMSPMDILKTYDFTNKNRTEDLCVVTTKSGRKYLDTIDKKESRSLINQFLKAVFGSGPLADVFGGPLANKDTTIAGVEEYLFELFSSDEDNEVKKMKLDSQAYKTTAKIAGLAAKNGFDSLEKVIKVDCTIKVGKAKFETVQDLQKLVGLLKLGKNLETKISELKAELAEVPPADTEPKAALEQRISNLKNLKRANRRKIFLERYGSENAKKLPFDDLQLLLNYKRLWYVIRDDKKTEQELKTLVDSIKGLEKLFDLYGVSDDVRKNLTPKELELLITNRFRSKITPEATSKDLKKLAVLLNDLKETSLLIEEFMSAGSNVEGQESTLKKLQAVKEELLSQVEWERYDEEVKEHLSLEDIRYLIKHGYEDRIGKEKPDVLKQLVDSLKEADQLILELEENVEKEKHLEDLEMLFPKSILNEHSQSLQELEQLLREAEKTAQDAYESPILDIERDFEMLKANEKRVQDYKDQIEKLKQSIVPSKKEEIASDVLGKVEKEVKTVPQEPLSIEEIMKDGQKYVDGLSKEELKKEYDRVSYLEATEWDLDEKYNEYLKLLEAKAKEIGEIK